MAGAEDNCRIAIAALEVLTPLRHAIDELSSCGATPGEMCLAATPGTIDAIKSSLTDHRLPGAERLSQLLGVEPLGMIPDGVQILATSGRLLTTLGKPQVASLGGLSEGACWLVPGLRKSLFERILSGDAMLMTGPVARDRWVASTRVLLRHSRHPVQGYEFGKPVR